MTQAINRRGFIAGVAATGAASVLPAQDHDVSRYRWLVYARFDEKPLPLSLLRIYDSYPTLIIVVVDTPPCNMGSGWIPSGGFSEVRDACIAARSIWQHCGDPRNHAINLALDNLEEWPGWFFEQAKRNYHNRSIPLG